MEQSAIAVALLFSAFAVAAVAGALVGRWWFVLLVAIAFALIAIFLRANDGWYGAGWGDFGVELNLLAAAATLAGAASGVAFRRASERS